jgi:glycosyltransferase involved in cell wall biosynthesis
MSDSVTLSACLIVRDEEKNLPECLDSLRPVVDEVIVVDTGSKDQTPSLAAESGARVFTFPWDEDFSNARNAALARAKGQWILVVDGDERIVWTDYHAFREPLKTHGKWGYLLTLINQYENSASEVLLLRLFRNHPAIRYAGIIHERVDGAIARLTGDFEGSVGYHPARIIHTGYLERARREKDKDDRDIRLLKKQIHTHPSDPFYWYKLAVHPYARKHLAQDVKEALDQAWKLLRAQDPKGTKYSYTPEVAAQCILSALGNRNFSEAVDLSRRSTALESPSPNLDFARGYCALVAGDLTDAARRLERALSHKKKPMLYAPIEGVMDFLSLTVLSEVRYLQGRVPESQRLYQRSVVSCHREPGNAFHGSVGAILENGDPGIALLLLGAAARKSPQDPFPWKRGGELFLALGLFDRAQEWLERALCLSREGGEIQILLDQVRHATSST